MQHISKVYQNNHLDTRTSGYLHVPMGRSRLFHCLEATAHGWSLPCFNLDLGTIKSICSADLGDCAGMCRAKSSEVALKLHFCNLLQLKNINQVTMHLFSHLCLTAAGCCSRSYMLLMCVMYCLYIYKKSTIDVMLLNLLTPNVC